MHASTETSRPTSSRFTGARFAGGFVPLDEPTGKHPRSFERRMISFEEENVSVEFDDCVSSQGTNLDQTRRSGYGPQRSP